VDEIPSSAVRGVDDAGVACTLERGKRAVFGGHDVRVWVVLVGPPDVSGAPERCGVVVPGAAFGCEEVVVFLAILPRPLVQVRAFHEVELGAVEDCFARADELAGCGVVFLEADSCKGTGTLAVVPEHVHEPLFAVVVVEEAGVEAAGVYVDGVAPGAGDGGGCDDQVGCVLGLLLIIPVF